MKPQQLTETLYVRVSPQTREALERIAAASVARQLSDHVRLAVEEYITSHDPALAGAAEQATIEQG